jgi:predicted GNAT family N-acyltransferase
LRAQAAEPEAQEPEIRPARSHAEFLAALRVRVTVFVTEQHGPLSDEPDAWDGCARHFVLLAGGAVVGTARLYQPVFGTGQIGRVALLPPFRGRGWGQRLLRGVVAHARALGLREVVLHAQVAAVPLYQRAGFQEEGEPFVEAGILHQRMRLRLVPERPLPEL